MESPDFTELTLRVSELEFQVRLLCVLMGVLVAAFAVGGLLAWMWLRARHTETMGGFAKLSSEHDEIREDLEVAELSRATRSQNEGFLH